MNAKRVIVFLGLLALGSWLWALGSGEVPATSLPRAKSQEPRAQSRRTRHAINPARMTRAIPERERPERIAQGLAHTGLRCLDENRADVDAFARHHASRRALQRRRVAVGNHLLRQP